MKKEITKIDNIISLYGKIDNKTEFIKVVAKDTKRKPNTVRTHWFSSANFYSIPEEFQDRVIQLAQNTIACQNKIIA
tara:strand:- start:1302 stop:1532 length:231 start_codon:yes stop_codon:yes gene_type:complete